MRGRRGLRERVRLVDLDLTTPSLHEIEQLGATCVESARSRMKS